MNSMKWRNGFVSVMFATSIRPPGDSESCHSSISARQVSGAR